MRIVHLIAPAAAGGAETAVRSLAIGQRNLGHQVDVVTLTSRSTGVHPFVQRLQQDGIRVTDVRTARLDYLAESRAVSELLQQSRADVLHTHVYHADTVGYVAATPLGVPQVATMHGFTGGGLRMAAYEKMNMWVLRRCAAVVAVSPNVRQVALDQDVSPDRVYTVPNGYEPSTIAPVSRAEARIALKLPDKAPVVGWIGRLSREKAADAAIEAFAKAQPSNAHLVIIGDGPERINLELIARHTRGAQERVHFAGPVPDAARYMSALDVLLLSSRTEGTPMVLLEAMAAKTPIVSYAVGGVPAMLTSDSACLAPPGDVTGLSRALTFALACQVACRARAANARLAFDKNFTVAQCASRTMQVYTDVTRARSGSTHLAARMATRFPLPQPIASTYRSASR